jgi:hypothetical protein
MTFPFKISNGEGGRGGPFKPDANYYNYDVAEKYSLVRVSHQLPILKNSVGLQGKNTKIQTKDCILITEILLHLIIYQLLNYSRPGSIL